MGYRAIVTYDIANNVFPVNVSAEVEKASCADLFGPSIHTIQSAELYVGPAIDGYRHTFTYVLEDTN